MQALDNLQAAFEELRADRLGVHAFSALARDSSALLQALPPRYGEVLQHLLDRLESSALFTEESCSFSQRDLLDNLQTWIDKARGQLTPAGS